MVRSRLPLLIGILAVACALCGGVLYSRYVDWPSFGGTQAVRTYLPEQYPISDAHHYTNRNFMDTWELYKFSTSPEAIAFLAGQLNLGPPAPVQDYPMIISRPPPYWWHPELLHEAELYPAHARAPDGHSYELLYSPDERVAYLIRFDG